MSSITLIAGPPLADCSRCRVAPAGRVMNHALYGRRSYCAACWRCAGDMEEAIIAEMEQHLFRAVLRHALDLSDEGAVHVALRDRLWNGNAIAILAPLAIGRARGRLARRTAIRGAATQVAEGAAFIALVLAWAVVYCLVCPAAHAEDLGRAAWSSNVWVELLPILVAIVVMAVVAWIVIDHRTIRMPDDDDGFSDPSHWGRQ